MGRFERVVNAVLAIAAIAIAAAFVHKEFADGPAGERASVAPDAAPTFLKGWQGLLKSGVELGDTSAKIKVIEFADFECPFCKRFDSTMHVVELRRPKAASLVFIHYPLTMHRFARPAAKAAECAAKQGRFEAFHDLLYAKQDSLGLKAWNSYAQEAGVTDTTRFAACITKTEDFPRIDAGVSLAKRLGVHATPTVIVNGWEFAVPPDDSVLSETIDALLAGKQPPASLRDTHSL